MGHREVKALLIALAAAAALAHAAPDASGRTPVLNDQTLWRSWLTWRTRAVGTAGEAKEPKVELFESRASIGRWVRDDMSFPTPAPPADWMQPAFDDLGWTRRRLPILCRFGERTECCPAVQAVRGRFGVAEPGRAGGLRLALACHGGVVVYLNGTEVGRRHLPAGTIGPLTLADDYGREAFVTPDGRRHLPPLGRGQQPPKDLLDRYEKRVRRAVFDIPAGRLAKGTNVLAVEVHRTAIPPDLPAGYPPWHTCALLGAELTAEAGSAVVSNVSAAQGARVWTADRLDRPEPGSTYGDPFEGLRPIVLHAPRRGAASGQVVVCGAGGLKGWSAQTGGLKGEAGMLPPAAVRVRYGRLDRMAEALLDRPPAAAMVPVWVTVEVPAGCPPGAYRGRLAIRGLGDPVAVPVELTVHDWDVGRPADWKTSVNLLQSPQSLAGHYKVAPWSDRHFALMERSLELMGRAGNDVLGVNAVARTLFGDDPLVVFSRAGGGWAADLRYLRRYLKLYGKHAAAPQFLAIQVWHYGMYYDGKRRDGRKRDYEGPYPLRAETIPIHELRGETLVPAEMPMYGRPGTEEVWRQVLAGVRDLLGELGWRRTRLLLGTAGDAWPSETTIGFFRRIAPDVGWRVGTHGSSVHRWGRTREERTQANGMVCDYANLVRRGTWKRAKPPEAPAAVIARDVIGTSPFDYFGIAPLAAVAADYSGFCWLGLDIWGYTDADGTAHRVLGEHTSFGNIVPYRPSVLAAPGPDGPVPTVQFEMLREGIQLAEAMLFMRAVLADEASAGRLGNNLAQRARDAVQNTCDMLEIGRRISPHGSGDMLRQTALVYRTAAEVAARTATP